MSESVKGRLMSLSNQKDAMELYRLLEQMRADMATICAKLDADATVTDTDYAAQLETTE